MSASVLESFEIMVNPVSAAATTLVNRFRRQRPLRGGSLLVSIFGDAIAPRGGAVTLGSLIELAAPFGLNERLVRTSMARLAADGWFENRRRGRLSEYRLSREGRERFAAATQQIYAVPGQPWPGSWTIVLVPPNSRKERQSARDALSWAGFGEPIPGVFAHPTLPGAEIDRVVRRTPHLRGAVILTTADSPTASHRRLATLAWDLSDLAERYRRFAAHFTPALTALADQAQRPPAQCFLLRTLLIHEYRKIHLRDPMLPAELLPSDWVGTDAYHLCRSIYERVAALAEQHLSAHAATLDGPLPPATAELYARFGGLAQPR